jgi:hypothetical protein
MSLVIGIIAAWRFRSLLREVLSGARILGLFGVSGGTRLEPADRCRMDLEQSCGFCCRLFPSVDHPKDLCLLSF